MYLVVTRIGLCVLVDAVGRHADSFLSAYNQEGGSAARLDTGRIKALPNGEARGGPKARAWDIRGAQDVPICVRRGLVSWDPLYDRHVRAGEIALAGGLALQFPILRGILQEHLDYYETLLPHLFMADVTRWIVARYVERGGTDDTLGPILDSLEIHFASGDAGIHELLAASFLELLPYKNEDGSSEDGSSIRLCLGPNMTEHVQTHLTW